MRDTTNSSDLISYEAVSAWTGIKLSTLYGLVRRKRIPHVRLGRRLVRFDREKIALWIEQGTVDV